MQLLIRCGHGSYTRTRIVCSPPASLTVTRPTTSTSSESFCHVSLGIGFMGFGQQLRLPTSCSSQSCPFTHGDRPTSMGEAYDDAPVVSADDAGLAIPSYSTPNPVMFLFAGACRHGFSPATQRAGHLVLIFGSNRGTPDLCLQAQRYGLLFSRSPWQPLSGSPRFLCHSCPNVISLVSLAREQGVYIAEQPRHTTSSSQPPQPSCVFVLALRDQ